MFMQAFPFLMRGWIILADSVYIHLYIYMYKSDTTTLLMDKQQDGLKEVPQFQKEDGFTSIFQLVT